MIPVRVENLLPGGKNLGVTHITNGAFRVHPVEWNVGEAAGILAAFCLERNVTPRAVRNRPELLEEFQSLLRPAGHRALLAITHTPVRHPWKPIRSAAHRNLRLVRRHEPRRRGHPRGDSHPIAGDRACGHHRLLQESRGHAGPTQGRTRGLARSLTRREMMPEIQRPRPAYPWRRRDPLRSRRRELPAGGLHRAGAGRPGHPLRDQRRSADDAGPPDKRCRRP